MALFSGLLLASDFDDTLLPTSRVRGAGAPPRSPPAFLKKSGAKNFVRKADTLRGEER